MNGTVLRLHWLTELLIETPMCLNKKVVKELNVGEMMRLLYIAFILVSRIIHFGFGEVCQLFC